MKRTTKRHFDLFRQTCATCIEDWGIVGWQVTYRHAKLPGAQATCTTRQQHRIACLSLTTHWEDAEGKDVLTDNRVRQSARHEATHLLIATMVNIISSRYVTEDECVHAEEALVRHLQELLP